MERKLFGFLVLLMVFCISIPSVCFGGEKVILMFPEPNNEQVGTGAEARHFYWMNRGEEKQKYSESELFAFVKKFEDPQHGYRVELIELWIEGKLETRGVTKLFISLQGGGGCKVVLRPKQ